MAPLVKLLGKHRGVKSIVCVTGQHDEMLTQALEAFDIRPDINLRVMRPNQKLSMLTAGMLELLDRVVIKTEPDWIIAQGDTTTVLVAALVSYYNKICFAHIESGLRSGNKYSPYPEEENRIVADHIAEALFAPTERNRMNLLSEGIPDKKIMVTGNTVVDALFLTLERSYDWRNSPLAEIPTGRQLVMITAHRRESFGVGLREICYAIKELAESHNQFQFVYPVHLNPNVTRPVREILGDISNVSLLRPLDYVSTVQLMRRAKIILTDSGGIQEEAPSFRVPVLVMRETTERPEGIEAGVSWLVGTSRDKIVRVAARFLEDREPRDALSTRKNPYGDGKAAARIVSFLLNSRKPRTAKGNII